MPYLGNEAADRFVSQPAVDQFSGDGSTTAFTLSFPVTSDQDILVSVNGVVQDVAAYAVSSGTTLTFTAAPSSNSGNNIFVNYLARTHATVAHPATSALTATTGTFTDDVTVATNKLFVDASTDLIGMGTTSPATATGGGIDIHRGGGSSVRIDDTTNSVTGEMQVYSAGLNLATVTNHSLLISTNNTTAMNITGDGEITKPKQPAFFAHAASIQSNIAINTTTDIVFGTEVFDIGANFASNTFTAPITGKYQFSWCVYFQNLDTDTQYYQFLFLTSNRTYYQIFSPNFAADAEYQCFTWSGLIDMDASDTAKVQLQIPNSGAAQADVYGDSNGATFFSGFLAC